MPTSRSPYRIGSAKYPGGVGCRRPRRPARERSVVLVPGDGRAAARRNRIHIDVSVPHDQAEARVAAAVAAGGHLVTDEHAPAWWTPADAEGNVATWMGRD
ncbi:VOC family protein [Actinophytocola sp.]|uniref:VOC family protein n=1 Tax=Actinophytocola sp. TaxID=1872138 RepID=UPI0025C51607|nr:VOC family protein [Actinophytocola sp.]